jgi:hypothetical protein
MKMPNNIFANVQNFVSRKSFEDLILAMIVQIYEYLLNLFRGKLTKFLVLKIFYMFVLHRFVNFLLFCLFAIS